MKAYQVFGFFLIIRILSVFIVKTWFVPDEYWQSLEVGHKIAFGYGHLTWEWSKGIRSYIHPVIIAGVYKILEIIKLDQVEYLILVPRILQAFLTAFADFRFYRWCNNSKWAIFLQSIAWCWFYTGSRTLSNTMETSMTIIALSYFPWQSAKDSFLFLWIMELAIFMRPTAVIPWLPLAYFNIKNSQFSITEIIFKRYFVIGLTVKIFAIAVDCFVCNKFILTPWEFLKFNYFEGIASFYGTHEWYWYIFTGLPIILGITLLPFLFAVLETVVNIETFPIRKQLLISIIFSIIVYSTIPHKEFRFILPLLPMCLYITADYLSRWSHKASSWKIWIISIILLIGNILPATYISYIHQKGTIDVMPILAKIAKDYRDENGQTAKFMFLMPCHSTPYYSHIHQNITMRFLTCEPNFNKQTNYLDEADQFYKGPEKFLRSHIPIYPKSAMPTHLIMFDNMPEKIPEFLINYEEINSIFHSDISNNGRIGKNVLVYERADGDPETRQKRKTEATKNLFNDKIIEDEI